MLKHLTIYYGLVIILKKNDKLKVTYALSYSDYDKTSQGLWQNHLAKDLITQKRLY